MTGRLTTIALLLFAPLVAQGQVNTEKIRMGSPDPGLHGWVDAGVLLKMGNVDLLQITGGARLEYNHEIHQA